MTRSVWRKRVKVIGLLLSIMMLALWVFSGLFVIVLAPLAIHVIVGFKHTSTRDTWRAYLSPSMLLRQDTQVAV